jgi:hypothetical protein
MKIPVDSLHSAKIRDSLPSKRNKWKKLFLSRIHPRKRAQDHERDEATCLNKIFLEQTEATDIQSLSYFDFSLVD